MAMQIRSDLDLPTLRIMLDAQYPGATDVVFQVVRGRGTPHEAARCPVRDLGLPQTLTGMRPIDDGRLTVPTEVLGRLADAVPGLGFSPLPPETALWLEFPSPRGSLYVMPWERLLQPLGRSVFRLPNHLLRPQAPGHTLQVAICASSPQAKAAFPPPAMIVPLAQQYLSMTGHDVTVHVFTDQAWFAEVHDALESFGPKVAMHDPSQSARYPQQVRTPRIATTAQLNNPWLLWIRDAMEGLALDFVHFVTHGYMSGDRGAIAVSSAPVLNTDRQLSRFIGWVELNGFLAQVGSWGLVLTGPVDNYSDAGLREVADSIAMNRPGVTMTHDFGSDVDGGEFGHALQTILGVAAPLDHPLSALTCWVHPRFVDFPVKDQDDLHVNADGSSVFVLGATTQALAETGTQSWIAAATRVLESQQVRWLPDSAELSADPAAVTALGNVADLVDRHVKRAMGARRGGES